MISSAYLFIIWTCSEFSESARFHMMGVTCKTSILATSAEINGFKTRAIILLLRGQ